MGVAGELCITGLGLSPGYLNRPELTADRFVENNGEQPLEGHRLPLSPGTCLYRTGDLARWLPDGNIEFCGRMDSQVKIRGFRIELGEIESRLVAHDQVAEAAVPALPGETGTQDLVAYMVADGEIDMEALRDYLEQLMGK